MASIEEQFSATLTAPGTGASALGTRVYPNIAPDNPTVPYAVYSNVINRPEVTLANGVPLNNTHMQVTVWDKVYGSAKAAAAQVEAVLTTASFTNVPLSSQDVYDPDTKRHGVRMEYSIWY